MSARVVAVPPKKKKFDRHRVELVAEPAWIRRVNEEARELGLSLSSYIRLTVNLDMQRREAERQSRRGKSED
jgi:hypothetical protein